MHRKTLLALPLMIAASSPAFAHVGHGPVSGFPAGLSHPFLGADHLLAMVSVGLWAAIRGGRSVLLWPAAFLGAMAFGAVLAMGGIALPFVEPALLASVIVLGALAGLAARPSLAAGAGLVALFGLFHGHAHGTELPLSADGASYLIGFLVSTGVLHGAGVAMGVAARPLATGRLAPRALGWAIWAAGVALVAG